MALLFSSKELVYNLSLAMRVFVYMLLLAALASCGGSDCCVPRQPEKKDLIKAADISFLPDIENDGVAFKDAAGTEKDLLDILKKSGVNMIRLRVWHTPETEHSSLAEVKILSERIKAKGLKVWLTVHYSDTWADPGHQKKPEAWVGASFTDLQDSVYRYTKKIMTQIDPDIIQIGNEINGGFIFPEGSTGNVSNFIALLKKGVQAVRETSPDTQIMVHLAGFNEATWLYQQLANFSVDYDLIGLSYYPMWHGKDLTVVQANLNSIGLAYSKPVVIAETAYPFTLGWEDDIGNVTGETGQLLTGYPATPAGQKAFLFKVRGMIEASPRGAGFCYWGAEWLAYTGELEIAGELKDGSSWENQALFDFDNKALPALEAFTDEE